MKMKTGTYRYDIVWPRVGLFGLLLALALAIPAFGWPQAVTGTLVNALLLLAVELLGVGPAVALGALTPLGGLLHGVLPLPMAAMLPFIMLGNATLASVYGALRRRNRVLSLGLAALAKFAVLYAAIRMLAAGPLSMPPALINMMSWPQLVTALAGGLLAFAILRALGGRRNQFSSRNLVS